MERPIAQSLINNNYIINQRMGLGPYQPDHLDPKPTQLFCL